MNNSPLNAFYENFLESKGFDASNVTMDRMEGDGSNRVFLRLGIPSSDSSFIIVVNPPTEAFAERENRAYFMIGRHLKGKGISVPEIFRFDAGRGLFIVEDLGTQSLQTIVSDINDPLPLYENIMEQLLRMQVEGADEFDPSWCSQTETYDMIVKKKYEAHYFRDQFLGLYLGLKDGWDELEPCFIYLAESASARAGPFFLHRDFQSRNIVIKNEHVGIVDWQGGRLGPLGYDLASIIIDPYTDLDPSLRRKIFHTYMGMLRSRNRGWADDLRRTYPYLAIQRNLQILGAFSFLTKIKNKNQFEKYIPIALESLKGMLGEMKDPELSSLKNFMRDI